MRKTTITSVLGLVLILGLYSPAAAQDQAPIWSIEAPTGNWFGTGNTERGLGYNAATGNLIVASRQGGAGFILIDAATSDSVGKLSTNLEALFENFEGIASTGDPVEGWTFTNTRTWVLSGYGHNSDKYAGWDESTNGDHSITSPQITNPGVVNFWVAAYNNSVDTQILVQSSPDGTTWTTHDTLRTQGAGGDIGLTFINKTVAINAEGAQYIRWATNEWASGGFYLDDVSISSGTISGGTFPYNQVRATSDGQIFTANLTVNAATSNLKIYRWANEDRLPKRIYDGTMTNADGVRYGDALGAWGSGDNVTLLVGGTNPGVIGKFVWNGAELVKDDEFIVDAGVGRGGYSHGMNGDYVYAAGTGVAPRAVSLVDGSMLDGLTSPDVAEADLNSVMLIDYYEMDGQGYIAAGPAFTNGQFYLFSLADDGTTLNLVSTVGPLGNNANGNNTGGVIYDPANMRVYLMDTNNALAAYSMEPAASGPVNVTFTVNTATMPDTLRANHTVQIKGGVTGPNTAGATYGIDWSTSSLSMDNQGGDYWSATFEMSPGDTLNYKFWAGVDPDTPLVNGGEQGWESGDNNVFVLPAEAAGDTVLPLQWFETRQAPFESKEDTVAVWFRVNVGAQVQLEAFDPASHSVSVRGVPAPLDWGANNIEMAYEGEVGTSHFYSGVAYFDRAELEASVPDGRPAGTMKYKFVLDNGEVTWEATPDRYATAASLSDTTIHWTYFSDERPTDDEILDTKLNFSVNVGILEGLGYFNSSIDSVFVRGTFNSWGSTPMQFNNVSGEYDALNIPLKTTVGADVLYKYYILWDPSRDDPASENFLAGITHDGSGWEEPGVTGGGDRPLTIVDAEDQPVQTQFYNGVQPQGLMIPTNVEGGAITVTFRIDMTPAVDNESQPFKPESDSVYLFVDTPFFALTNGITVPGDGGQNFFNSSPEEKERLRFTDADGDGVYELDLDLRLPTLNHIGFRVAYGEPTSETGSLFVHGEGFAAGRRHYQYVQPIVTEDGSDPDNLPDVSWPSTYTFPVLTWKAKDLAYELPPDYGTISSSTEEGGAMPTDFVLEQNYPNPFNPATTIRFALPQASQVTLAVYNVLGQRVATLMSGERLNAGVHSIGFDASGLSSGMYVYRLEAGTFVQQRSMTLLK